MLSQKLTLAAAGAAGAEESYWIAYGDSSSSHPSVCSTTDSSGNVYTGCDFGSAFGLVKFDSDGQQQYAKNYANIYGADPLAIDIDSSSNLYICGTATASTGTGSTQSGVVKATSAGALSASQTFGDTAGFGEDAYDVAVDGSSVYVASGGADSSGNPIFTITKLNSALSTKSWERKIGASGYSFYARGVDVDSSGNVYVCGYGMDYPTYSNQHMIIAKYNSSGTIQWQRVYHKSGANVYGISIAVDSSANVYVSGTAGNDAVLVKYNSSGALQWQRALTPSGNASQHRAGCAVDSSGNVYLTNQVTVSSKFRVLIAKYNSSGTIQWQRSLGANGGYALSKNIHVDSKDNFYITAALQIGSNSNNIVVAKLPNDGSLTGVYGDFFYTSSSATTSTPTNTSSTGGLTEASHSTTLASAGMSATNKTGITYAKKVVSTDTADPNPGGHLFEGPGSFTWTAPTGVTSVSAVVIAGGRSNGGPGGALAYKNSITVSPGTSYAVEIGDDGSNNTYFINTSTVRAEGRSDRVGDGGGNGGFGSVAGGGAGGYSGNGGSADGINNNSGGSGSGGGAGAGGGVYNYPTNWAGGGGGGTGVYGAGSSGSGGSGVAGGGGGSGGDAGTSAGGTSGPGGNGGKYGGAAGQGKNGDGTRAPGAVRIIWGANRSFPSTNVDKDYAGFTESFTT